MAINLIVTVLELRAPGLTFERLPLFVWAVFITAWLLVLSLPVLAGVIAPALKMAICWKHQEPFLQVLGQSAGNLDGARIVLPAPRTGAGSQENLGILRDYTPKIINENQTGLITYELFELVLTDKLRTVNMGLIKNKIKEKDPQQQSPFAYYLAGLIEGSGSLQIPKTERSPKGKINFPSIQIAFDSRDLPLALIIQKELGLGSIKKTKGVNGYRLTINNYEGKIKKICILTDKFRTVKLHDLNRLIQFLNQRLNLSLPLSSDSFKSTPQDSNPWLSGFIDAEGHFFVRKNSCGFELVQANTDYSNRSKKEFKLTLAEFLQTSLRAINKSYGSNPGQNQWGVRITNLESNQILIKTLRNWPLKSSKYLNYKDFEYVVNQRLNKEHLTSENKKQILSLSKNKNNQRSIFYWDHLQKFYS